MKKLALLLVAAIAIGSIWYASSLRPPHPGSPVRALVVIPKGSSVMSISETLGEASLVRSPLAFRFYVRLHGSQARLQAGSYLLSASMGVPAIVDTLQGKLRHESVVTVPEGFSVRDIASLLSGKGLIQSDALLACAKTCDFSPYDFLPKPSQTFAVSRLEGYLFPDTYFFVLQDNESAYLLGRMLENFRKRVIEGLASDLKASKHSLHEIITMASLIEEEAKADSERPVIAGILWKRFDAKAGLGVDAAVRYVLAKPTGALTETDLQTDSPYNLRRYRGLPPGPIANPGLLSIRAALHPADSPYWYYLHDRNGTIHYAITNDEHNANKAKYLQ